jgi:phenylalanyl-tRNA synthetase beta chain
MLVALLDALQIEGWQVEPGTHPKGRVPHPALHPGRAAVIRLDGHDVAYFGELHPHVAAPFEIEGWPVQVAEVDLDALFSAASKVHVYHPLPRYPAALRDIAVVVGRDVPAGEIMRVVRQAGDDLLESATIFDVYQGEPLPPGEKSVAIAMTFRAPGATLTQDEVNTIMDRIVTSLREELHAALRT